MKLGVSYNVFDGIELLESSIRQIRPFVDIIHVAYQMSSWFGKPIAKEDIEILQELLKKKLIDKLEVFINFKIVSNSTKSNISITKTYETKKRQFGLSYCLSKECTHFMSMDVDEYYLPDQFKEAKEYIISKDLSSTTCRFINYVNLPIYHRGYSPHYVPFICKINKSSKIGTPFFVPCDNTRGITDNLKKTHIFSPNVLTMHHMETIRKNLFRKYESTTRSIFKREKITELIKNIQSIKSKENILNFNKIIFPSLGNQTIYEVENKFNIPYKSW